MDLEDILLNIPKQEKCYIEIRGDRLLFCTLCLADIGVLNIFDHLAGRRHKSMKQSGISLPTDIIYIPQEDACYLRRTRNDRLYNCTLCNAQLGESNIIPHIVGARHKYNKNLDHENRAHSQAKSNSTSLNSQVKSISTSSNSQVKSKGNSLNSQAKSNSTSLNSQVPETTKGSNISLPTDLRYLTEGAIQDINATEFYCSLCDRTINKIHKIAHVISKEHVLQREKNHKLNTLMKDPAFQESIKEFPEVNKFYCNICKCDLQPCSYGDHLFGKRHEESYYKYKDQVSLYDKSLCPYLICVSRHYLECSICNHKIRLKNTVQYNNDNIRHHMRICTNQYKRTNQSATTNVSVQSITDLLSNLHISQPSTVSVSSKKTENIGTAKKETKVKEDSSKINSKQFELTADKFIREAMEGFQDELSKMVHLSMTSDQSSSTLDEDNSTTSEATDDELENSTTTAQQNTQKVSKRNKKDAALPSKNKRYVRFYCALCGITGISADMQAHIQQHSNEAKNTRAPKNIHGRCGICLLKLYGPEVKIKKHFQSVEHVATRKAKFLKKLLNKMKDMMPVQILVITGPRNWATKEVDLRDFFQKFGVLKDVVIHRHQAFVEFIEPGIVDKIRSGGQELSINGILVQTETADDIEYGKFHLHESIRNLLLKPEAVTAYARELCARAEERERSHAQEETKSEVLIFLLRAVINIYPSSQLHSFGSRRSGLTLDNNSDLDLFLDIGDSYSGQFNQEPKVQREIVKRVYLALKGHPRLAKDLAKVPNARVPIVSFTYVPTGLKCDISFKNGLSCQNTRLIRFFLSCDPRVKPIVLFVKQWVSQQHLHSPPNFSSYAITMLVIFYLQQLKNPILPTVQFLQSATKTAVHIATWNCGFNSDLENVPPTKNVDSFSTLLKGFFAYYAVFEYKDSIISPLTGTPVARKYFERPSENMPRPYNTQWNKLAPENFSNRVPLCVLDPFDLSHNLTKSFTRFSLELFIYLCESSEKALSADIV